MNIPEVIKILRDHFRVHKDDRFPTPYLDEAASITYDILEKYDQILTKFGSFERAMSAEFVTRCENCYHYNPEELLCDRWGLEKPVIMLDSGFCSCGVNRDDMEKMLERCRANGGWCTPGEILTADELKRILEAPKECN